MTATGHLEESLQRALDRICNKMRAMASLAERALADSLEALLENNGKLAYSVILADRVIDELEKEIDRLCLEFLVRQQPAGTNLRFVYAAIKINQDLERIGDYAESIARQGLVIGSLSPDLDLGDFRRLAEVAIPMVSSSVRAFVEQDEALAWKVIEDEERANEWRDKINADLYQLRERGVISVVALTPLMTVARRFERASDQAKNICEEALYVCTGKYMKHQSSEVFRVLFVDDRNSVASQMAEAIANHLNLDDFVFSSAGMEPAPLDGHLIEFMKGKGLEIADQIAKSVDQIPNLEHYQVIVALSKVAEKVFPSAPTKTIGINWNLSEFNQGVDGLERLYDYLNHHIKDLTDAILGEKTVDESTGTH